MAEQCLFTELCMPQLEVVLNHWIKVGQALLCEQPCLPCWSCKRACITVWYRTISCYQMF